MSYRRFSLVLIVILIIGIFLVADNLNQQLCCDAAPIVDLRLSGERVRLSVLNASFSVGVPSVFQQLSQVFAEGSLKDVNAVTLHVPKVGQAVIRAFSKAKPVVVRFKGVLDEARGIMQTVFLEAQPKIRAITMQLSQGARSFSQKAEALGKKILDRFGNKRGQEKLTGISKLPTNDIIF